MKLNGFHVLAFLALFSCTAVLFSQTVRYQETVDARQELRLESVEQQIRSTDANVAALTREMAGLRSSLDRFTGIGIGLGAALTALQGLLVIITIRNGKSK